MRKITALKSFLVAVAAFVSVLGLVGSASATTTWTVSGFPAPPSSVAGTSTTTVVLTDAGTGTQLMCTSAGASITGTNGTGMSGTGILHVVGATWSNCSGPLGITFSVTPQNLPWSVNVTSYDPGSNIVTGTITGVEAHISGVGCTADVRGPSPTTPGTLFFTYNNATHVLTITGGNLHIYNVSGACLGLMNPGDIVTYAASYVFPGTITVTSP